MQERLEFMPEEHTDFVFSVVVDDWSPVILTAIAAVGLTLWLLRRRRRRSGGEG